MTAEDYHREQVAQIERARRAAAAASQARLFDFPAVAVLSGSLAAAGFLLFWLAGAFSIPEDPKKIARADIEAAQIVRICRDGTRLYRLPDGRVGVLWVTRDFEELAGRPEDVCP